jgi:hypothetical protein
VHSGIVWSLDHVLFFLFVWHVLKTWCLWLMEKIKDVEMECVIFDCFRSMVFMSINLRETIELLKSHGREKVECFNNLKPNDKCTQYFWVYYCQLGM